MSDQTAETVFGFRARVPRFLRLWRWLSFERAPPHSAPRVPDSARDPSAPTRRAAAAKPGLLVQLSSHILHVSVNTAFLFFVALITYTAWQLYIQRSAIILQPITVPEALTAEGYTSDLATRNLRDEIQYLQNAANTKFGMKPCLQANQTDWNTDVNAIDLPGTGLSIRDIVDLLRSIIPGLQPREITGEFFLSNNKLVLELWLGDNNIYYGAAGAPGIDQGTITSLINGIDSTRIEPATPPSDLGAAFAIIMKTQPYIAASALDSWGDESNAVTILNDIIGNAPKDDPELPWADNLLGYIDLKSQQYQDAIPYLQKAPNFAIAHSNLCYIYFDRTQNSYDTTKALAECTRAIELDPELLKPHELLGQIYAHLAISSIDSASAQQNFQAAVQQFRTVETLIKSEPNPRLSEQSDLAAAYDGLGAVYANQSFREHDAVRAETEYRNAVNLNLLSPTPLTLLGNFYAAQGQWDLATQQYQLSLLKRLPDYPDPRIGLGNVDLAQQNWRDALAQFQYAAIPPFATISPILQSLMTAPKNSPQIPTLLQTACRELSESLTPAQNGQTLIDEINASMKSLTVALQDQRPGAAPCAPNHSQAGGILAKI